MASGRNNVTRSGDPVAAFLRQVSPARSCNPDAARQWARCPLSAQMDLYPARRRLSHELLPGVTEGCWEGTTRAGRLGRWYSGRCLSCPLPLGRLMIRDPITSNNGRRLEIWPRREASYLSLCRDNLELECPTGFSQSPWASGRASDMPSAWLLDLLAPEIAREGFRRLRSFRMVRNNATTGPSGLLKCPRPSLASLRT